jgi:hypothetical protein
MLQGAAFGVMVTAAVTSTFVARAQDNEALPTRAEDDRAAQHLEDQLDDIRLRHHRLEQLLTEQRSSARAVEAARASAGPQHLSRMVPWRASTRPLFEKRASIAVSCRTARRSSSSPLRPTWHLRGADAPGHARSHCVSNRSSLTSTEKVSEPPGVPASPEKARGLGRASVASRDKPQRVSRRPAIHRRLVGHLRHLNAARLQAQNTKSTSSAIATTIHSQPDTLSELMVHMKA